MNKVKKLLSNKWFLIIVGVVVILIIIALYSLSQGRQNTAQQITPQQTVTPNEGPPAAKIVVGDGVFVKNFTTSATPLPGGDSKIAAEESFDIIYFEKFDSFLISILKQPFETYRTLAESEFLRKLDISKDDACKLKVTVNTPSYVDPALGGKNFQLSFCE